MDNPLVQPDPGLFFWTIAVFLTLLFLLRKYAWGPLLAALEERQAGIRKSPRRRRHRQAGVGGVAVEDQRPHRQGPHRSRRHPVGSSGGRCENPSRSCATLAQKEAQTIKRDAQQQIQLERDRTVSELRREAVELSVMIASKLIRRNLTREDNAALIDEALQQVDSSPHSVRPCPAAAPRWTGAARARLRPVRATPAPFGGAPAPAAAGFGSTGAPRSRPPRRTRRRRPARGRTTPADRRRTGGSRRPQ